MIILLTICFMLCLYRSECTAADPEAFLVVVWVVRELALDNATHAMVIITCRVCTLFWSAWTCSRRPLGLVRPHSRVSHLCSDCRRPESSLYRGSCASSSESSAEKA